MTRKIQILCVVKTGQQDAHARIKALGGGVGGCRWKHLHEDAIMWIEDGTFAYYALNNEGMETKVVVASNNGHKYLKTEADNEQPDCLLNLPECS